MSQPKLNSSEPFASLLHRQLSRRGFVKSLSSVSGASLLSTGALTACASKPDAPIESPLTFNEVPHALDSNLTVPEHYQAQVLLRWGDGLFNDSAEFNLNKQTEASQLSQFGYNNDFVGFLPLPLGSTNSNQGLLVINHEATEPLLMHPGLSDILALDQQQTAVDMAAHGLSVVEINRLNTDTGVQWQVNKDAAYNRRITPHTAMQFSGPAAGYRRLKNKQSPDGVVTLGTYGNCAGGVTPWGTVLTAEENINKFFDGDFTQSREQKSLTRMGFKNERNKTWSQHDERFNLSHKDNDALHAGWIVEVDPYEPNSKPVKHTALGRFKHEACNLHICPDGTVVAYMGDDQAFEYLYKFVSKNKYIKANDGLTRAKNKQLLTEGFLYVAKLTDDNQLTWLPLIHGQGPLTNKNRFYTQADVLIDTRKAADFLGATPMDRPEDVEVNPVNGKVYVMLTNNKARQADQLDKANPRANNRAGQIIELIAPNNDHKSNQFTWQLTLLAGNPSKDITFYHPNTSENGWLACPDNCVFDNQGHMWISSDGAEKHGVADGLWATPTAGPAKGLTKRFLRTPMGAELCGPFFTPDNRSLFCAIQHPGSDSTLNNPSTRWPDFDSRLPPRPAVVAISQKDKKVIGS